MHIHILWPYWTAVFTVVAGVAIWLVRNLGRAVWLPAAGVLVALAALDLALGAHDAFRYTPVNRFPYLGLAAALPLLAGGMAFAGSATLRNAFRRIPQHRLIGIQTLRIAGAIFVALYLQGVLPAIFALPAGAGDVLVGVSALFLSARMRRGAPSAASAAVIWNLAGILDLIMALSLGFLSSNSPLQLIFTNPSSAALTQLPLVLVPAFAVPVFLLLHAVSLARLLSRGEAEGVAMHTA